MYLIYMGDLCLARIAVEFYIDRSNPQMGLERLHKKFP